MDLAVLYNELYFDDPERAEVFFREIRKLRPYCPKKIWIVPPLHLIMDQFGFPKGPIGYSLSHDSSRGGVP